MLIKSFSLAQLNPDKLKHTVWVYNSSSIIQTSGAFAESHNNLMKASGTHSTFLKHILAKRSGGGGVGGLHLSLRGVLNHLLEGGAQ